jgi:hypothetical protein
MKMFYLALLVMPTFCCAMQQVQTDPRALVKEMHDKIRSLSWGDEKAKEINELVAYIEKLRICDEQAYYRALGPCGARARCLAMCGPEEQVKLWRKLEIDHQTLQQERARIAAENKCCGIQ